MRVTYSEANETRKSAAPVGVADFLAAINTQLSRQFARIEGEVTSIKDSYPTAVYFTIKDTTRDALLNCVIWRTTYNQNGVRIKEGDAIIVSGTPEIYAARGTFSLKVQTIEYAGEGQLKRAYDELRLQLSREGLLESASKRPLPLYPTRIGVITSRAGVVIQDFSANLGRYGFSVTMVDSRVEGKDALHELTAALHTLATADIEILVIMRGGGSWESLQAFNTESIVRMIATFPVPVLTGIGHDVDETLAELVADVGASTPTAVAEKLNESWDMATSLVLQSEVQVLTTYRRLLLQSERALEVATASLLQDFQSKLTAAHHLLQKSTDRTRRTFHQLAEQMRRANAAVAGLVGMMRVQITHKAHQLRLLVQEVARGMSARTRGLEKGIETARREVCRGETARLLAERTRLHNLEQIIRVSDPAYTLRLGYSLSYHNGTLLRSVRAVTPGGSVTTMLEDGSFTSTITTIQ